MPFHQRCQRVTSVSVRRYESPCLLGTAALGMVHWVSNRARPVGREEETSGPVALAIEDRDTVRIGGPHGWVPLERL